MSPVMCAMQGAGEGLETSDRGIHGGPQAMPNEAAEAAVQPSEIDVVEAAHAALASLPAECATESDRLLALCEKLVEVCPPIDFQDPLRAWMPPPNAAVPRSYQSARKLMLLKRLRSHHA